MTKAHAPAGLRLQQVVKRYGGLTVTDALTLTVPAGELHAIIGPNGAGKTTLIKQIGGEVTPDAGEIFYNERAITRLPTAKRALLGLARSYQITSVFTEFTVLQNVAIAMQAHLGHSFRFFRPMLDEVEITAPAREAIATVGLSARVDDPVSALAHGERRQLELAMVLVAQPNLLLLDEPMAGMSHQESVTVIELLKSLKGRYTMVLVEHDMDAVFALADRISVLVYGRLIASGSPDEIRVLPEVRSAYLGSEELAPAQGQA